MNSHRKICSGSGALNVGVVQGTGNELFGTVNSISFPFLSGVTRTHALSGLGVWWYLCFPWVSNTSGQRNSPSPSTIWHQVLFFLMKKEIYCPSVHPSNDLGNWKTCMVLFKQQEIALVIHVSVTPTRTNGLETSTHLGCLYSRTEKIGWTRKEHWDQFLGKGRFLVSPG